MYIKSLLDNDLYKFTMGQAAYFLFPDAPTVKYKFFSRNVDTVDYPDSFVDELKLEIDALDGLGLEKDMLPSGYVRAFDKPIQKALLKPAYCDFLRNFKISKGNIDIRKYPSSSGNFFGIEVRGLWYEVILYEVILLALIERLYHIMTRYEDVSYGEFRERTAKKMDFLDSLGVTYADFGTRRRFSYAAQNIVIEEGKKHNGFVGTSNLHLASKHDVKAIGTQAHEWFSFHAAKYGYKSATEMALKNWLKMYQGDLGIALADTFTSEEFFRSFTTLYAKTFDGVRHDSGNPFEFVDRTVKHYERLGIDPTEKTIVFSDSLDVDTIKRIHNYIGGRIGESYGIGTNFTNDFGLERPNIVLKLVEANFFNQDGYPPMRSEQCIKLSDSEGKATGDEDEIEKARKILDV